MMLPIVVFGFNRPDALERMFESLAKNPEFEHSEVYVFIDGPRSEEDQLKTEAVAEVARRYTDNVRLNKENRGLGPSIIAGVTEVMHKHGAAIIIEDDLVLAPNFLAFMNQAMEQYKCDPRIMAVCGYGFRIKRPKGYIGDVYLGDRSSSWGWATWVDRWESVDWDVTDWKEFSTDKGAQREFNRAGSDMTGMLRGYMEGRNRSWAIRFCYSQFRQGRYSVHPFASKVENEGFGLEATNCRQSYSRFRTDFDRSGQSEFTLPERIEPNPEILRQLHAYHSLPRRIYSRIRRLIGF